MKNLPRVPLWQWLGLLTVALLLGSLATMLSAGRPPRGAFEVFLVWLPGVVTLVFTVVLALRARRRESDGSDSAGADDDGAERG